MYMVYHVFGVYNREIAPVCIVKATEDEIEKGVAHLRHWKFSRSNLQFAKVKYFDSVNDISKMIYEQKMKELEENAEYHAVKKFLENGL